MAQKKQNTKVEIKGLISDNYAKAIKTESKSLFGAVKQLLQILKEDVSCKEMMQVLNHITDQQEGNHNVESQRKTLLTICREYAPKQLKDGTICSQFVKSHTDSNKGRHITTDLFKGYKVKETFSVGFVAECWNRFLKSTPCTYVDEKFMSADDIVVKYVEMCAEKGLSISENMELAYDAIMEERNNIAEAV